MSFLRTARQPALRPLITRTTPRLAYTSRRAAHQDYGSGAGNPAGEKPEQQGKNPSESLEHPGPAAPSVGGSSSSSSSGGQQQQQTQQKGGSGDASSQQQSGRSQKTQGAQPKILAASPPRDGQEPEDVTRHNREMDQRAEKANEKVRDEDIEKDKVPKSYWSGRGGADRQP